jgi:hypothetical protein
MITAVGLDVRARRSLPASLEREAGSSVSLPWTVLSQEADDGHGDAAAEGSEHGSRRLPLDVRQVRLSDLPALRRLDTLFRFNQPDAQLQPYSPLRSGLSAGLPGGRGRRSAFVACLGERLVGFAEFRAVYPDQRWLLLALGGAAGVYGADPVWEALLAHGVRSAGLQGSKRLYARLPQGSPVGPAARRVGWVPYASETIFSAYDVVAPAPRVPLRSQRPADTWAIHQLYNAAVPRPVQDAEAFTSHRWDVRPGADGRGTRIAGWLLEEGHQLLGYARVTSRGETHLLEAVHHPERRDVLPELIGGALASLPGRPARRVYCPVRTYQAEVASRLEERGFVPILEQDLHVRYTTVNVRSPALDTVPFHVEVRDKLPQRVPTFLRGETGDGAEG